MIAQAMQMKISETEHWYQCINNHTVQTTMVEILVANGSSQLEIISRRLSALSVGLPTIPP